MSKVAMKETSVEQQQARATVIDALLAEVPPSFYNANPLLVPSSTYAFLFHLFPT
jgi:hypothetical protein